MSKRGFTLVELLAVIVVLAVILIIAVPRITNTINSAKDGGLRSSAMMVASQAEKEYITRSTMGTLDQVNDPIECSDVVKLNSDDYDSCTVKMIGTNSLVDIVGKGKFAGKYVCNGTKESATVTNENCNTYATTVIVSSGNMTSDGTGDNNLRYSGENPNNYVTFNGEIWRIIGIFNVSNESITEQRIKIIRNTSIGNYSWDSSASDVNFGFGVNDWSLADLNTELNTIYYNRTSGICYYWLENESVSCDFSSNGLNATARSFISSVIWNLGGTTLSNPSSPPYGLPTLDTYNKERGTQVYSGRPTTWTGIVGLPYPSDYGYASTDSECRTNIRAGITYNGSTYNYNNANCKNNNWLYTNAFYWTLTSSSSGSTFVFSVYDNGKVDAPNAFCDLGVRPVVYLKSNIKITSGLGTSASPYILSA